jgi:hypothetical protein
MPTAMKLVRAVSSIRVYIVLPFPNLPQPAQGDAVSRCCRGLPLAAITAVVGRTDTPAPHDPVRLGGRPVDLHRRDRRAVDRHAQACRPGAGRSF